MAGNKDGGLEVVEHELNFLRRHVQNILTEDFSAVDEAEMAITSALRALEEYRLNTQPSHGKALGASPLAA